MEISILMLTYNAPFYVFQSIIGVYKCKKYQNLELIVLDNASNTPTKIILKILKKLKIIDKLILNHKNDLFAKGNNIASQYASKSTTHYLLLNSDIKIKNKKCFNKLAEIHPEKGGISSFGAVLHEPIRADGYCMLIDKWLFDKYNLDEDFEWWWSITKLESQVLGEGFKIYAIENHEEYLHHYGGKSGKGYENAKGMDIKIDEVIKWFDNKKENVKIIKKL